MTDKDGGAILAYETREKQALLNEAMRLSLHFGAGKPAEVHPHRLSPTPRPNIVSRRTGRTKAAVSTLPSLAYLAKLNCFSPSSILSGPFGAPPVRSFPEKFTFCDLVLG